MTSRTFGNLMRISVIAAALSGLFLCAYVIPSWGQSIVNANPELGGWYRPWLIFEWLVALPCFAVLVYVWKVSDAVMKDTVFTMLTAKWVKMGSVLLLLDAHFCSSETLYVLAGMSHPVSFMSVIGDILSSASPRWRQSFRVT